MKNVSFITAIVLATVSFISVGCSQLLGNTEQDKTVLINGLLIFPKVNTHDKMLG
jgi:hypothetical protein